MLTINLKRKVGKNLKKVQTKWSHELKRGTTITELGMLQKIEVNATALPLFT